MLTNLRYSYREDVDPVQEGAIEDRDDRLGRVQRERTQSRALAPGEQNGLHDNRASYRLLP